MTKKYSISEQEFQQKLLDSFDCVGDEFDIGNITVKWNLCVNDITSVEFTFWDSGVFLASIKLTEEEASGEFETIQWGFIIRFKITFEFTSRTLDVEVTVHRKDKENDLLKRRKIQIKID
jgi:hypothetical protein